MGVPIIRLDKEGYEQYLKKIEEAEQELHEIQRYKGEEAIHQGDHWHDNPTLYLTEMKERSALKNLSDLREGLSRIEIVDSKSSINNVGIGNRVTVSLDFGNSQKEHSFKLVSLITDIFSGEISIDSPLGSAVFGKQVGDTVTYLVNKQKVSATITKIE